MASRRRAENKLAADPVSEWLASGQRLRAQLLDERVALQERLAKIEEALVRLSAADADMNLPVASRKFPDLSQSTVQEAIVEAVKAHRDGATIAEIRSFLRFAGKAVDPGHVPSYLFKMKKAGVLSATGGRGGMVYALGAGTGGDASE